MEYSFFYDPIKKVVANNDDHCDDEWTNLHCCYYCCCGCWFQLFSFLFRLFEYVCPSFSLDQFWIINCVCVSVCKLFWSICHVFFYLRMVYFFRILFFHPWAKFSVVVVVVVCETKSNTQIGQNGKNDSLPVANVFFKFCFSYHSINELFYFLWAWFFSVSRILMMMMMTQWIPQTNKRKN